MSASMFGSDKSKTKHDWYQSVTDVTITVLIKNLSPNDVKIELRADSLWCLCNLLDGTQYELHLNLFKPINVSQSGWKLSVSKLEINLKKQEPIRWSNLEAIPQTQQNQSLNTKSDVNSSVNVSQDVVKDNENNNRDNDDINKSEANVESNVNKCKTFETKNWDKIVKELEKEEEEETNKGEGNVDDLFKRIYEKGGEEVRRAMNKSFTESGGTVLSTNWSEVSQSKVEVKPPDGCEHKKWDH